MHGEHFKRIDDIPNEYEMIYKSQLHYTMNFGKFVSSSLALPSIAYLYYYGYLGRLPEYPLEFIAGVAFNQDDIAWFSVGLLAHIVCVYRLCDIAALRIYRCENE